MGTAPRHSIAEPAALRSEAFDARRTIAIAVTLVTLVPPGERAVPRVAPTQATHVRVIADARDAHPDIPRVLAEAGFGQT